MVGQHGHGHCKHGNIWKYIIPETKEFALLGLLMLLALGSWFVGLSYFVPAHVSSLAMWLCRAHMQWTNWPASSLRLGGWTRLQHGKETLDTGSDFSGTEAPTTFL